MGLNYHFPLFLLQQRHGKVCEREGSLVSGYLFKYPFLSFIYLMIFIDIILLLNYYFHLTDQSFSVCRIIFQTMRIENITKIPAGRSQKPPFPKQLMEKVQNFAFLRLSNRPPTNLKPRSRWRIARNAAYKRGRSFLMRRSMANTSRVV